MPAKNQSDKSSNDEKAFETTAETENKLYKSCLKQIVEQLNTTLPAIEDESSEDTLGDENREAVKDEKKLPYKIRDHKKKTKALTKDTYSTRDVTPTREREIEKKEPKQERSKKRVNKYSERRYNEIKERKSKSRK